MTPTGARSQLTPPDPAVRTGAAMLPLETALRPIDPMRDAFAPRARVDDDPPVAVRPAMAVAPAQLAALPHVDFRRSPTPSRLAAVATGARPIAIVEIAGSTRTLTIGDMLEGSPIASIAPDAVVLANGRRLSLAPVEAGP